MKHYLMETVAVLVLAVAFVGLDVAVIYFAYIYSWIVLALTPSLALCHYGVYDHWRKRPSLVDIRNTR